MGEANQDAGGQPLLFPAYRSTALRAPLRPPVVAPATLTETTGPAAPWERLMGGPLADLTTAAGGVAQGQRIVVAGRVLDEDARPVADTVVELWQANAAGRYRHDKDQWDAPLDPAFIGAGRAVTDGEGRYRFFTVRPGAYPWKNHDNAWRPAHIHFSLLGPTFASRLVTQMYFPDDPLHALDPILAAVPEAARSRLVARFDLATTRPEWALGYVFDIVLRGPAATPAESAR